MYANKLKIKVGSVTNAQRARAALQAHNIRANISRIEDRRPGEGCGYAVTAENGGERALEIISGAKIRILGVEEA